MNDALQKSLEEFFSAYPLKQYHKGQILIYAHEVPRGIFFIESGTVRKYDVASNGDEVVLNVFEPHVFFPMEWALAKTPNKYFFEALTPIEVRCAPVDEFVAYLESKPGLAYSILKRVSSGLEIAHRRVVLLMAGNKRSRLLFELLIEAHRSGEMRSDGSCLVTISSGDLAQRAGLARETISRELNKLVHAGDVVQRENRSLLIRSLSELEELLSD